MSYKKPSKYNTYFYQVERYFTGSNRYYEVFKATCLNSLESARKEFNTPLLTFTFDTSEKTTDCYTDLTKDKIVFSYRAMQTLETMLKKYTKDNNIPFNSKRALIDLFKFIYVHELYHIKYTKRLHRGKDIRETIEEITNEDVQKVVINNEALFSEDFSAPTGLAKENIELFKMQIVSEVIYQIMNVIEDRFINRTILKNDYKNQYFDDIEKMIVQSLMSNAYMYRFIVMALNKLEQNDVSTIDQLCDYLPTQHDYVMFIWNILVENNFKIKLITTFYPSIKKKALESLPERVSIKKERKPKLAKTKRRLQLKDAHIRVIQHDAKNKKEKIQKLREQLKTEGQNITKPHHCVLKKGIKE